MEKIKVLVLDDNAAAQRLMELLLDQSTVDGGVFHTHQARTLAEAVAKLGADDYDAVLTDLMLPDSRGVETFRSVCKASRNAAVIVMTGLDDTELAVQLSQEGAEDYIVKGSMNTMSLATRVRFVVMRYRRQRAGGPRCDA